MSHLTTHAMEAGMRKSLLSLFFIGVAGLAAALSSTTASAAGVTITKASIGADTSAVSRIDYYRRGYGCCRGRYYDRRAYYAAPRDYYVSPPVVYYPPPVVYYAPPVVAVAPYAVYGGYGTGYYGAGYYGGGYYDGYRW